MASATDLVIAIKATDKASPVLEGISGRIQGMSRQLKIAGGLMMGTGLAIGGMAMKMATDMGKAHTIIQAGTGATGEEMVALKDVFKDVYGSVSADMGATAGVIAALQTGLGATGDELADLSENVLEVSRMLGTDAVGATETLAKVTKAWGLDTEGASKLMDKLFVASQETGIGFNQLGELMINYGGTLRTMGLETNEIISLLGGMHKAGIPITRVMPGMTMATRKFAEAGMDVREGLMKTIKEIKNAKTATEALTTAQGVFGSEGAVRLSEAIRAGTFDLNLLEGQLGVSEGAVREFSDATEDPATKMAELKHKIELVAGTLGEALIPGLQKAVEAITPIIEKVTDWIAENPVLSAAILGVITVLGALMLILPGIVAAIGLLTWPILAVVAVVAGLIAIGVLLWKNWDKISAKAKEIWEGIVSFFTGIWDTITGIFKQHWDKILAILFPIVGIPILIARNWDKVKEITAAAWNAIADFFTGIWDTIVGVFTEHWDKILAILFPPVGLPILLARNWDEIKEKIAEVWDAIVEFFRDVWERIKAIFSDAVENITGFFAGIWEGLKAGFASTINFIIDKINWLIDRINLIPGISVPLIPGIGLGTSDLPSRQFGGIVPGPVGTPVPILAHGGERISRPGDKSGQGGNIIINFTEPVFMENEGSMNTFVAKIETVLRQRQRLLYGEVVA